MLTRLFVVFIAVGVVAAFAAQTCRAQEFYYDLDTTYGVVPSPAKIGLQFDTIVPMRTLGEFLTGHPCLDPAATPTYLDRGFWIYGLQPGYGYEVSAADLSSDPSVSRVVPVYQSGSDSIEFKVSDLVDVQFEANLPVPEALAIVGSHGLRFVDSSTCIHNLWTCALDDTIRSSPLPYGNAMHVAPSVMWACARQYANLVLAGVTTPTDPYYQNQYYLKNTGQNMGIRGIDIAAEPAWEVPLSDSSILVAVIDDGLAPHPDLPASRIVPGYDFAGNNLHPCSNCPPLPEDADPAPGQHRSHGLAAAGVLAASHNSIGIAGVCGSCRILPLKILDDNDNANFVQDPMKIARAFDTAWSLGARVISCSWTYRQTAPIVLVANAIRRAVDPCPACLFKRRDSPKGAVVVFAAGNDSSRYGGPVQFPANMPEVISVGAVRNDGTKWDYSPSGTGLTVVAPSGDIPYLGDVWTVDQAASLGWNPAITGPKGDIADHDYTKLMGGTSAACPQVAGIAALLLARGHCNIDPERPYLKVKEIITSTASQDIIGYPGWNPYYGYGRANAYKAMLSIIRGDVNNDGFYDVLDVVKEVDIAFSGDVPALGAQTGDLDCDGFADVFDVIYLVNYAFGTGPAPVICYQEW